MPNCGQFVASVMIFVHVRLAVKVAIIGTISWMWPAKAILVLINTVLARLLPKPS